MKANYSSRLLKFNFPGATSRGVLHFKPSFFLILKKDQHIGIGEISIIPGLSIDDNILILEEKLKRLCSIINDATAIDDSFFNGFPSLKFGYETALKNLNETKNNVITKFKEGKKGITINGLIWMGSQTEMLSRIKEKLNNGFRCLKLKIGALNFHEELSLLKTIRSNFTEQDLELRLDANGAFSANEAGNKLAEISKYHIHSIEQPIAKSQIEQMANLCETSPIPIALDEELINVVYKLNLLEQIKPQYIILKPSILGGLKECDDWINLANKLGIEWWATSALESNVGLNAIADWISLKDIKLPQGLGTGQVFSNNIPSPLTIRKDKLWIDKNKSWDYQDLI